MADASGNGTIEAAPQYSWININGIKLAYRDTGSGEPIVLIHANISDVRSGDPIESRLARQFCVIASAAATHGQTNPSQKGRTIPGSSTQTISPR